MEKERLLAMRQTRKLGYLLGIALLLAGCSSVDELFDEPIEPSPTTAAYNDTARRLARLSDDGTPQAPPPVSVAQPPNFTLSVPATAPKSTGTFVGKKTLEINGDYGNLRQSVQSHAGEFQQSRASNQVLAQQYHSIVAGINTRLQVGTTPGNPILNQQWNAAQAKLSEVGNNVLRLEELRGRVATDATLAGFLLEQVQAAYRLSGAVEEDHAQLRVLEDDINRTSVTIERLISQIDQDVNRQHAYVANQRRNLSTLALGIKNGELYGPNLSSFNSAPAVITSSRRPTVRANSSRRTSLTTVARSSRSSSISSKATNKARKSRKPILAINFNSANVAYESNLYAAVSDVVARNPGAGFEVVAISPGPDAGAATTSARRTAKRVVRSLINMGVPETRLQESARVDGSARSDQVLVYEL
jgi:hypothetical protein